MNLQKPNTSFSHVETAAMQTVGVYGLIEAVKMNLFDHIDKDALSADELAGKLGAAPAIMSAMLDLFVEMGIITSRDGGYKTNEMSSEYLVSTSPFYQGQGLTMEYEMCSQLSGQFSYILKGESPDREGSDEAWATQEMMEGTLQHALDGQLQEAVEYITSLPEFKGFRKMADIGGNHCQYSIELLKRNRSLSSTVLDLPHVVQASGERCSRLGFGDRIKCTGFDMRSGDLPDTGFDFIFSSHVLYGCIDMMGEFLDSVLRALNSGGVFVSHHYAPECSASPLYRTSVELVTRLCGYDTHFIPQEMLENELKKAGFVNLERTVTGSAKRTLLVVARKP